MAFNFGGNSVNHTVELKTERVGTGNMTLKVDHATNKLRLMQHGRHVDLDFDLLAKLKEVLLQDKFRLKHTPIREGERKFKARTY